MKQSKAIHIIQLEQAVNKLNLMNYDVTRESVQSQRHSRIKLLVKCPPPLRQRLSIADQVQSSRSTVIKSAVSKKKHHSQNQSQLEQKINQLRYEIEKSKKTKINDKPQMLIYSVQHFGFMKKLQLHAKQQKQTPNKYFKKKEINKQPQQLDSPDFRTTVQNHLFLKNIFSNPPCPNSTSCPSTPPNEIKSPEIINTKPQPPSRKYQRRSCSQEAIKQIRKPNEWPIKIQEFSGWDIHDEEFDSRLG